MTIFGPRQTFTRRSSPGLAYARVRLCQGPQPLRGVGKFLVVLKDPHKQITRSGNVARTFVQIGEGVPQAEMVPAWTLGRNRTTLEKLHRVAEPSLIGEGACRNNAAFHYELSTRRR